MGAWIETPSHAFPRRGPRSHPTWVRGLKHEKIVNCRADYLVAPYVGAWIETINPLLVHLSGIVAPYVGAWIETLHEVIIKRLAKSHPTWVRGLKLFENNGHTRWVQSHPTWVRGLKLEFYAIGVRVNIVAPYVGAWIETSASGMSAETFSSRTLRGCVD